MSIKRKLSEFGAASNGGGIEGVLRAALDGIDEGGVLIFDAVRFPGNHNTSSFEYAVFSPITINKSILIEGESSDIRIVNKTAGGAVFNVNPTKSNFFFGLENLLFVSGSRGVSISGSNTLSPNSRIFNVGFLHQTERAVSVQVPETNLHLENVYIKGSPQYGLYLESHTNHDFFSIDRSKIDGATIAGISFVKTNLGSGSVYISQTELLNNAQAIVVDNVRYYEHNVEFISNEANVVLSGTSQRLTASGGGGGGTGVTDHGQLTGLSDNDHKVYYHVSGTNAMAADLNMQSFAITNVGAVDGRDVSVDGAALDAHILDSANPHATSLGNLDPGTLAELNALVLDADVVSEATFNSHTSSYLNLSASYVVSSASFAAGAGPSSSPAYLNVTYFNSPTSTDEYTAPANFGTGSEQFVVAVWYRGGTGLFSAGRAGIAQAEGVGGWRICWNFGVLNFGAYDGTPTDYGANVGSSLFYGGEPSYIQERDAVILFRVTSSNSTGSISTYVNNGQIFATSAAAPGFTPSNTPLKLGGLAGFGLPMVGGIQGAAYIEGTLTDSQIITWTEQCMHSGGIIPGDISWLGCWSHLSGAPEPDGRWPDISGNGNHLTASGTPGSFTRTLRLA